MQSQYPSKKMNSPGINSTRSVDQTGKVEETVAPRRSIQSDRPDGLLNLLEEKKKRQSSLSEVVMDEESGGVGIKFDDANYDGLSRKVARNLDQCKDRLVEVRLRDVNYYVPSK